jgi:DNA-binding transcriptional regulator PaaX
MTRRTNASERIRKAMGNELMSVGDIRAKTGFSELGARSALRAMVARGEVSRYLVKRHYLYQANDRQQESAA